MKGQIFEDIINDIEDYALFLLNTEGKIVSWNRGAERIKGYKESEVTGKGFELFYTEEDRLAGLPAKLLEEARTNGRVQSEGWRVGKYDDRFWAYVVITAVKDADGNVTGFVKITRDLSERMAAEKTISDYETDIKELALKSQRLKSIYQIFQSEVTDYAIIMLDKNGMIVDWNPGARKIKGYEYEEVLGKHFSVFYSEEDKRNMLPESLLMQADRDGRVEHEGWRIKKDGSRFWANVIITALHDREGQVRGYAKITKDQTQRLLAENALKQRIEELEQEIERLKVNS